ncbi:HAD family hydrolase [Thomasclavelia sp.]
MKKYKAVIYDLDGTILDTIKMNMLPLMKIIEEETGNKAAYEEVLKYAAWPGMETLADLNIKDREKTYARWVKYVNEYNDGAKLFDGFEEVFNKFNGKIVQAIVSSKTVKQYQIDVVEKGIDKYMKAVILADDTLKHKPDPEPILKCLKDIRLEPKEVIYIGDSLSDYQAANSAEVDFGYAAWGSVSSKGIDRPTYVFNHPLELLKLLK